MFQTDGPAQEKDLSPNVFVFARGGDNPVYCASRLADSSGQSFSGGTTGVWTGVSVENSIFIGRTDNLGEPRLYTEELNNSETLSMHFDGSFGKFP